MRRQLRMLLALRAELILNMEAQAAQFVGAEGAARRALYERELRRAGTSHSMPMAVVSETNDAYAHVKDSLSDLPASVLPEVIGYYQSDEYVAQLLRAFSGGDFEKVKLGRRLRALGALFKIGRNAAIAAQDAVEAVDQAIKTHASGAEFNAEDLELTEKQAAVVARVKPKIEAVKSGKERKHRPVNTWRLRRRKMRRSSRAIRR